jgi:hypothetical protein
MSDSAFSKDNGKKPKSNRKKSRQRSQQTQIVNQPSTTAEPTFQSGDHYDERFPPLGESTLSQGSSSSHHSSEVFIVVLSYGFYLFLFFVF